MSKNLKKKLKPTMAITIAGLVLALLLAVSVILLAHDSSEKVEEAVVEKMEVALSGQVHSIDLVVDSHYATLKAVANHLENNGGIDHMDHLMDWMRDIVEVGDFYRISVTDCLTDTIYYADKLDSGKADMDLKDDYYFDTVKKSDTWLINGPYTILGTEIETVIITVPVIENQKVTAVVAGMITLEDFLNLITTEGRDSENSVYLIDSTGHIFVGSDIDKNLHIGGLAEESENDEVNLLTRLKKHAKVIKGNTAYKFEQDILDGKSGYMIFQADSYKNYGKGYMVYKNMAYRDWTMVYVKNRATIIEEFHTIQRENQFTILAVIALCTVILVSVVLVARNINNLLRKSNHELKEAAEKDFLTGLYTRGSMIDIIKTNLKVRSEESHVLLLIDIDRFKEINDTLGHAAGDKALIDFSECMKGFFRKEDFIGRFGGDEFFVFLTGVKSVEGLVNRLHTFVGTVTENTQKKQWDILGCSIGMSVYPQNGHTYEKLYREADVAMYKSKKKEGICKVTLFSEIE